MMRIFRGFAFLALVAAPVVDSTLAFSQSQRLGIEQTPLMPPAGAGTSTTSEPRRTGQQPAAPSAPQAQTATDSLGDGVVVQPPSVKISNRFAVYVGLDKITGRTTTFEVAMNETAQFGALQVTPRVCYTRPPTEQQNTTSFTEVNEVTLKGEAKRIFTGWMFASSPGLHAVDHPIYDVWLIGCKTALPGAAQPSASR